MLGYELKWFWKDLSFLPLAFMFLEKQKIFEHEDMGGVVCSFEKKRENMKQQPRKMDQAVPKNHMSLVITNLRHVQSTRWYVFLKISPVQQLQIQRRWRVGFN